jgi:hypothetical protein
MDKRLKMWLVCVLCMVVLYANIASGQILVVCSFSVVHFGALLNTLAVTFNGGRMPVLLRASDNADAFLRDRKEWIELGSDTRLQYLADRFRTPWGSICSIGDILLYTGVSITVLVSLISIFNLLHV